jgi:hypothetical protein
MSEAGVLGYGRSFPPAFAYVDLVGFSNWHTSNASTIATRNIQSNYNYLYDGGNNYILNGGQNMWTVGNIVSLGGTQTANSINYGTLSNVSSSSGSYGYFVSQPNVWPNMSLAYVKSGTIQWSNAGTVGANSNITSSFSGTYTTPSQDRYGSYWVNQQFGTSTPTICYVWFTVQQKNIQTTITGSNDARKNFNSPPKNFTQRFSLTGTNLIMGQTLISVYNTLSSQRGYYISPSTVEGFVTQYVQNAQISIY